MWGVGTGVDFDQMHVPEGRLRRLLVIFCLAQGRLMLLEQMKMMFLPAAIAMTRLSVWMAVTR